MEGIESRKAVITGGNRGIGLGVAGGFARAGAELVIVGLEPDVGDVAERLSREHGVAATGVVCDISRAGDVGKIASAVDRVDILVNNAGLEYRTPIEDPSPEVSARFRQIIDINVVGTFEITRALLPKMPDGARIINTASIWGKTAVADYSAYCASKHAIIGLTRSLARELGPRSISVNAVCPGWVRTEASMRSLEHMAEASGQKPDPLLDEIVSAQALDGLMEPADMVDMYLFLASDAARNITGQAFTVDRGELMR